MRPRANQPSDLTTYAKVRFERLIKLSREAVKSASGGHWETSGQFFESLRLYSDLLAQALLDQKYSPISELRLLRYLVSCLPDEEILHTRTKWLSEHLSTDMDGAYGKVSERLRRKSGAISLLSHELYEWKEWVRSRPLGPIDSIIAILSRSITDAAIVSRLCGIPVRYVCYSRKRLGTPKVRILDAGWIEKGCFESAALVDAHALTGETVLNCWTELVTQGISLAGALITKDELAIEMSVPGTIHRREDDHDCGVLINLNRVGPQGARQRAPLVVLCGFPGSGKTLVRKAITQQTGWPAYSLSRSAQRLLKEEFGGLSMAAVRRLTDEERYDPEIVAREFLLSTDCYEQNWATPLVIDGVKSLAGLNFLKRHLGRPTIVIQVERSIDARVRAVTARGKFDDRFDEERNALLERIGLPDLMKEVDFSIDASGSDVDRPTGRVHLNPATTTVIERLITRVNDEMSLRTVERRLTAAFLLLAPDQTDVLLLKSASSGNWGLPGGRLEPQEGPWDAAKRELREETGLNSSEVPILCNPFIIRRNVVEGSTILGEKVTTVFVARAVSRDFTLSGEHIEGRWVTPTEATNMLSFPLSLLPLRILSLVCPGQVDLTHEEPVQGVGLAG
jgi:8-oxo-dGTP pyrophosphatase MutT (NUDIX family)